MSGAAKKAGSPPPHILDALLKEELPPRWRGVAAFVTVMAVSIMVHVIFILLYGV